MYPLFESICVKNGQILHPHWHRLRFQKSFENFFGKTPSFDLLDSIEIPPSFCRGTVKLKIRYNAITKDLQFQHYQMQEIQSIRLVEANDLEYTNKYSEREKIEALFAQRGHCDDVLMVKNQRITDSSYANAIFFDGQQWWTPAIPLLEGTCRARLLDNGQVQEANIKVEDLKNFKGLKLINAMRGLDQPTIPIAKVMR